MTLTNVIEKVLIATCHLNIYFRCKCDVFFFIFSIGQKSLRQPANDAFRIEPTALSFEQKMTVYSRAHSVTSSMQNATLVS